MATTKDIMGAGGTYARLRARLGDDHPETIAAHRNVAHAKILTLVSQLAETYPPLTPEQVQTVTRLLQGQDDAQIAHSGPR